MEQAVSAEQLLRLLTGVSAEGDARSGPEIEPVKYAIYARKSTQDDERQERSIDDQIHDCIQQQVKPHGLNVIETVEESFSAKASGVRYKFRKLIQDIENGRITGIIAWHPDRLARNMKEAGEIIDLLDKGILKDLRFATFTFENNPTGKMLLGISFVLSQQYSEHLSESVSRGNRRLTEDGAFIGKLKHGYYISERRELHPEEESFSILQEAFQRRLNGESQLSIAKWLNTSGYRVRKKNSELLPYVWDKDALSKVFKDPVYAGVLKYGDNYVVLADKYPFVPMITVAEFLRMNKIKSLDSLKVVSVGHSKRESTKADLLRGVVCCGYCRKSFSSGLVKKKLKDEDVYYYYYKCETEDCFYKGKSLRARVIVNFAAEFFRTHLFVTKDNYDEYVRSAKRDISLVTKELTSSIARKIKALADAKALYEQEKELILNNPALAEHYDLGKQSKRIDELSSQLEQEKEEKASAKRAIFSFEEYLKLFQNIGVILEEMDDMAQLDAVIQKFFSNFTIKVTGKGKQQEYDITYKLKEPWQGFLSDDNFVHGRGERTQTFDLSVPNRARYQLRHTPIGVVPE